MVGPPGPAGDKGASGESGPAVSWRSLVVPLVYFRTFEDYVDYDRLCASNRCALACVCRVLLVLLEPLVLLDFRDLLVCLVLEEIVVHLVALVVWCVWTH